ncbi:MAG TPA: hypothetical protein VGD66_00330 [Allosphingosinicella sp.]
MSVADDIRKNSKDAFGSQWAIRDGLVVPDASDLKLSNDAVRFERQPSCTLIWTDQPA